MGVRFNKRITIFSWLRANVGKSGISLTIGPKGKTLNIGSTGVSVNVSLGKGVGYSKRLITWKKLNILSWLGIGGTAAAKTAQGKRKKGKKGTTASDLSLDEAIAEAEGSATTPSTPSATPPSTADNGAETNSLQEQPGCSWGCAVFACLATLVILALIGIIIYLLLRDGTINFGNI